MSEFVCISISPSLPYCAQKFKQNQNHTSIPAHYSQKIPTHTRVNISIRQRSSQNSSTYENGFMKPPAAANEAGFEKSLAHALYSFVRAGRLDEAVKSCRKAASAMEGCYCLNSELLQMSNEMTTASMALGCRTMAGKPTSKIVEINMRESSPESEEEEWEREGTSTLETLGIVHVKDRPRITCLSAGDHRSSSIGQTIDIPVPPLATQAAGQRELIAMYAVPLGDNAVERYAMFLTSLELTADVNDRRLAVTHVHKKAVVAAKRTIDRAFEATPSDIELLLLRSKEWTAFEDGTHDTALEQVTVILRYYLGAGRVLLAKNLVEMLPRELPSIDQPEERATEYLNFRQFFTIQDSLDRVMECQNLEVSIMNRNTSAACRETAQMMPDETGGRHSRELTRIRQIYLPELNTAAACHTLRLSRAYPRNLKRALELANTVADSRYRLYNDFLHIVGWRLEEALTQCAGRQ
ncbi:hypothetical protein DEU56DRAFT_905551 [Suillus clintonianus]|uniref:uncharacterized protein n=1 Tax=Suillus clintonianus TaxID=1904413 RepID=UPI001B86F07D|nr:uncharacterized protein DEU56DRAFT_905551 [Suillus clintonianus]KAG2111123.1 hypothetical protein DEU56DRAFT_905551 [Suillus clintonianus]